MSIDLSHLHRIAVTQYQAGTAHRWRACLAASCIVGKYDRGATLSLAQDLSLSVSQVENLAHAGWGWRTFRKYGVVSAVRQRLTPSHFCAMFDLWRLYEFDPRDAAGILAECAEHGASVASMRKYVDDTYDDKPPDWQRRLTRILPQVQLLLSDYGVPEEVRAAAQQFLFTVEESKHHETNTDHRERTAAVLE